MINVVIGLVFVLLLFSLLATTVMELIAGGMALRGKNLEEALKQMLDSSSQNNPLFSVFKKNPLYQQFLGKSITGRKRPPSYLNARSFSSILFDSVVNMDNDERLQTNIDQVSDDNLRAVLTHLRKESGDDLVKFKANVETWYDDVMDRASGWYKRKTQTKLLMLGFVLAVLFNADTISIYDKLVRNPSTRLELVSQASDFINQNPTIVDNAALGGDLKTQMNDLINQDIATIQNPLGLGWDYYRMENTGGYYILEKILGWLVTALAISLGSTFWFDLLKKLVNIRSSGNIPATSTIKVETTTTTVPATSTNNSNGDIMVSKPVG